ncbi:TadE/TadG family type IV pilus assembly protein [Novosphingobium lindaniclasticum]|uniref:TadE/TadG family type IV pilus assembly protein n=1 Tax=Novosphingobium lindaniclasticum TaxID=1329895 RepID=UPI001F3ACC82|nr:TadE/TadG family type IV pilus assembly protein [Novosphingobium lindaniclasticum]
MRNAINTGLLKCERGMATLEFVFLAPALLALAVGIVMNSTYFSALIGVRQAAAEAARAAVAGFPLCRAHGSRRNPRQTGGPGLRRDAWRRCNPCNNRFVGWGGCLQSKSQL